MGGFESPPNKNGNFSSFFSKVLWKVCSLLKIIRRWLAACQEKTLHFKWNRKIIWFAKNLHKRNLLIQTSLKMYTWVWNHWDNKFLIITFCFRKFCVFIKVITFRIFNPNISIAVKNRAGLTFTWNKMYFS